MNEQSITALLIDKLVDIQIENNISNDQMVRILFRLSLMYVKEAKLESELYK
ncbi:hypothetical protein [Bacillus sp. FJAT-49736]|uniref:hypothetical protein n=1 Tax=Bacillus sp. FJAT-49736 TaxID=2833582 RepID=UPI001BCA266D|nr:hypothetical protein [Bacillus sp. FJAT-49736]MBS4173457.1 hypothetical protein [Bacillus sp. FJAT-49736]